MSQYLFSTPPRLLELIIFPEVYPRSLDQMRLQADARIPQLVESVLHPVLIHLFAIVCPTKG
jgi:hypothetical protein